MTMQALTIQPPNPAAIVPHSTAFAEYLSAESSAFIIHTDEDLQLAADIINDIKERMEAVEAMRVQVTQPINQGLRAFNGFFKPFMQSGSDARTVWNRKIQAFMAARALAASQAEAALSRAIATQDAPAATAAIQAFTPAPRAAGLAMQDAWDFEVLNLEMVPVDLVTINRAAVLAELRRQAAEFPGTAPVIPGIRAVKTQIPKAVG